MQSVTTHTTHGGGRGKSAADCGRDGGGGGESQGGGDGGGTVQEEVEELEA